MNSRKSPWFILPALVCLALASGAYLSCHCDNDDDDGDDDTDPSNDPPKNLPACADFEEYPAWFVIEDFEEAANSFFLLYGKHFTAGTARRDENTITLQLHDFQITLNWLDASRFPSISDGQEIEVFIGTGELYWGELIPLLLWVINGEGETIIYHDQSWDRDRIIKTDEHTANYDNQYLCEYYDDQPPLLSEGTSWKRVFGYSLSGDIDGHTFSTIKAGDVVESEGQQLAVYLLLNYQGTIFYGGEPVINTQEDTAFLLQAVKAVAEE